MLKNQLSGIALTDFKLLSAIGSGSGSNLDVGRVAASAASKEKGSAVDDLEDDLGSMRMKGAEMRLCLADSLVRLARGGERPAGAVKDARGEEKAAIVRGVDGDFRRVYPSDVAGGEEKLNIDAEVNLINGIEDAGFMGVLSFPFPRLLEGESMAGAVFSESKSSSKCLRFWGGLRYAGALAGALESFDWLPESGLDMMPASSSLLVNAPNQTPFKISS